MQAETLRKIDSQNIERLPFPLQEILEGSLYYPGSGIDGTPIRNWSLGVNSFVYVDTSWPMEQYSAALSERPVRGYRIVAQRQLTEQELAPNGYSLTPPKNLSKSEYLMAMRSAKASPVNAFAMWSVFERDSDRNETFGPERFSLLHIRSEGVAAYEPIYISNGCLPKILAFIRPGLAFGGNYRTFSENMIEVMKRSPRGLPPELLWEHPDNEEPSLHEPWSLHYAHKIQGPLRRDGAAGCAVSLFSKKG